MIARHGPLPRTIPEGAISQDSQLQQAVLAGLSWEPGLTAAPIGIPSCEGTVTLTGHFEGFARKRAARRIKGIRAPAERIVVRLPSGVKRGDEKIAVAAVNRSSRDMSVPRGSVTVEVKNGWVAPSAQVDSDHRREALGENICTLVGICGVFNEITVGTRVNAADLYHEINYALHRSWFLGPDDVRVTVQGGRVCPVGAVQSSHDREVVAATAWAAPGAAPVLNGIVLTASF